MGLTRVSYLEIRTLEPLAVRGTYGRGGFYRSHLYIPSSTLAGAMVSEFYRGRGSAGGCMEYLAWVSHGFPGEPPRLGQPPALPLTTLSRKDGGFVSVAIPMAEAMLKGPSALEPIRHLDPKVGEAYVRPNDKRGLSSEMKPPSKVTEVHVALDYGKRTHSMGSSQEGEAEAGALFTQEVIEAGRPFHALAFLREELLDLLRNGMELRLGSMRSKGYGLCTIKVREEMSLNDYIEKRTQMLEKRREERWLIADVVSYLRMRKLCLGDPVYQKVPLLDVKFWMNGEFHLYRGLAGPGGVLVFKNPMTSGSISARDLAEMEVRHPSDPIDTLHGLDMVFFDNPLHFSRDLVYGR